VGCAGLCWAVPGCVFLPEDPGWHSFGCGMYFFALQSVKTGEHAEILSFFFSSVARLEKCPNFCQALVGLGRFK
jgi:hypothetical protein